MIDNDDGPPLGNSLSLEVQLDFGMLTPLLLG